MLRVIQTAGSSNLTEIADRWLGQFEAALAAPGDGRLQALFSPDCYWRDALAFTWDITTVSGIDAVVRALVKHVHRRAPTGFQVDPARAAPRRVRRAGTDTIEAIFRFDAPDGPGHGVLRLVADTSGGDALKGWTLLTALDELKGFEEAVGRARPRGESYSRDFRGRNWLDLRRTAAAYVEHDPAVLVVGAGQAGLSIAARLNQLQVDTLVIDRERRIGDNWRHRYHALTLHNQVQVNHLPYMPFPPTWPTYIPKDKLAGWLEAYAEAMEINCWTPTELESGNYDEGAGRWSVVLRLADGSRREMHPRHLVMAAGASCIPIIPELPTLDAFRGKVMHSSEYQDAEAWTGKRVLVLGTGTSGHDIAQDLHAGGAQVTMVQRSPTMVVNIEPSAQIPYALYDEGPSLEDCDLVTVSMPFALARKSHIMMTQQAKELDRELLEGLKRIGFRLSFGEDGSGWQFLYLSRGGGYYFNVGCSELIVERKIGLIQYADIERFVAAGVRLRSGETLQAELIVLATGYYGQDALVRKLFGDAMAARVGQVWGFDSQQELFNMFVRTPQPGLWFIAGSLAQCRIYSKYLGLQIKACEEGLLSPVRGDPVGNAAAVAA